jgi:pimeloyl-ACP methyl ester carboxylesterase
MSEWIMESPGSLRVDRVSGVREHAFFSPYHDPDGDDAEQMFVCLHEPPSEPVGGVVICSSVLADLLANYTREVHLARHLASRDYVVARVHHRGTGNSDGDPARVTLDTICDEARWTSRQLRNRLGPRPLAAVGTRWGAWSAAAVASQWPNVPLIVCEPVLDFSRYFLEAMRNRAIGALFARSGGASGHNIDELIDEHGSADVLGTIVHRALYDSTLARDPCTMFSGTPRPVLLVQFGGREPRDDHRALCARLRAEGWTIDVRVIDLVESWWFRTGPRVALHEELNETVADWLDQHVRPQAS